MKEIHFGTAHEVYGSTWREKPSPVVVLVDSNTNMKVTAVDDRGCGPLDQVDIDLEFLDPVAAEDDPDGLGGFSSTSITLNKAQAEALRGFLTEHFPLSREQAEAVRDFLNAHLPKAAP